MRMAQKYECGVIQEVCCKYRIHSENLSAEYRDIVAQESIIGEPINETMCLGAFSIKNGDTEWAEMKPDRTVFERPGVTRKRLRYCKG
jgi:hypothetical protein